MEITVDKSAIFTKDSLKVIQDKMRINCIENFNRIYDNDLTLKEKRKGKNFDLKSSDMEVHKQTEKMLKKEIKEFEEVKSVTSKIIEKQVKEKSEIEDEIIDKKKYNNKLSLKSKVTLIKENDKLKEELDYEKYMHYQYKIAYEGLKEKTDYLIDNLKKVINILPNIIKNIADRLFGSQHIQLKYFKQQYDSEEIEKFEKERKKKFNLFKNKQKENVHNKDYDISSNSKEKDDFER